METTGCFQVTSIISTITNSSRASILQFPVHQNPPSISKNKLLSLHTLGSDSRCRHSRILCKARGSVDEVAVVTDASWDSMVMSNQSPVLVEFWAPWCGPCRMIAPVIDELAKEYAGKIVCLKLNTDLSPNVPSKYGIRSIPTVLFFKNGEKKESVIGAVPKSTLTATIEKYLAM